MVERSWYQILPMKTTGHLAPMLAVHWLSKSFIKYTQCYVSQQKTLLLVFIGGLWNLFICGRESRIRNWGKPLCYFARNIQEKYWSTSTLTDIEQFEYFNNFVSEYDKHKQNTTESNRTCWWQSIILASCFSQSYCFFLLQELQLCCEMGNSLLLVRVKK